MKVIKQDIRLQRMNLGNVMKKKFDAEINIDFLIFDADV